MSLIDHAEWTGRARFVLALLISVGVVSVVAALLLMHSA
jgi:hypothetical protein